MYKKDTPFTYYIHLLLFWCTSVSWIFHQQLCDRPPAETQRATSSFFWNPISLSEMAGRSILSFEKFFLNWFSILESWKRIEKRWLTGNESLQNVQKFSQTHRRRNSQGMLSKQRTEGTSKEYHGRKLISFTSFTQHRIGQMAIFLFWQIGKKVFCQR